VSHWGRIKCPVRLVTGVNRETVWTWNAVAKRAGTWGLAPEAPESRTAFLLNHLIAERLPKGAQDTLNADPVTGQAAWYDLKVRLEPVDISEAKEAAPRFPRLSAPKRLGGEVP
jgi:hypothetical protein